MFKVYNLNQFAPCTKIIIRNEKKREQYENLGPDKTQYLFFHIKCVKFEEIAYQHSVATPLFSVVVCTALTTIYLALRPPFVRQHCCESNWSRANTDNVREHWIFTVLIVTKQDEHPPCFVVYVYRISISSDFFRNIHIGIPCVLQQVSRDLFHWLCKTFRQ